MAELVRMPKLGFDMAEGTLVRWAVAEGGSIEKGELLAEIETDKATVELEAPESGVVHKHLQDESSVVPVNTPIAVIGEAGEEVDLDTLLGDEASAEEEAVEPVEEAQAELASPAVKPAIREDENLPGGVRATPVARRMAEEEGVDLNAVSGSGPMGRIRKKDVESVLASPKVSGPMTGWQAGETPADRTIPLTRLRSAIGRRMAASKQELPHFYVTAEYDMQAVMDARKQLNAVLVEKGEKLSVNDFIIKAAALALREFPNLNASLTDDAVVQHGAVNIGVAVAVPNGLLTVVSKNADQKPLRVISAEVRRMAENARDGKVKPEEIEGSTFSISNLGMFDVEHFIAIINPPEAAILAIGSVLQKPVVIDGELAVGLRMKATISVDHRVSDGAEAAQFMQKLGEYLENPLLMMI